jgi:hypothetical protein
MKPHIIWAETRTASASLAAALRTVSDFPSLEDEPFLYNTPRVHAAIYQDWCTTGDPAPLYRLLEPTPGIKHIAEPFHENFNADLARACNHHGYRHIRLDRRDTFAQLASRGIAEQLDAWEAETAKRRFEHVKNGTPFVDGAVRRLGPLNVEDLLRKRARGLERWEAVSGHIPELFQVWTEDIVGPTRKWPTLLRLLRYLDIPLERADEFDQVLARGAQNSEVMWQMIPNIHELREAVG